jgi:hypothetical protein
MAPAAVIPAKAQPITATDRIVSGMVSAKSRAVGPQRDQSESLSMRSPVANRATITQSSDTISHGKGVARGSGKLGMPGTRAKTPIPKRISSPEAAGSRRLKKRGSQWARITTAPTAPKAK